MSFLKLLLLSFISCVGIIYFCRIRIYFAVKKLQAMKSTVKTTLEKSDKDVTVVVDQDKISDAESKHDSSIVSTVVAGDGAQVKKQKLDDSGPVDAVPEINGADLPASDTVVADSTIVAEVNELQTSDSNEEPITDPSTNHGDAESKEDNSNDVTTTLISVSEAEWSMDEEEARKWRRTFVSACRYYNVTLYCF